MVSSSLRALTIACGALVGVLAASPSMAQTVELVSKSTTAGRSANGSSSASGSQTDTSGSVSRDGRWMVFQSNATDLIAGVSGTNIYLYDTLAKSLSLVSHSYANPATPANQGSQMPVISADGNWIAFLSGATDLVPNYVQGAAFQLYVYNRATGRAGLVSRSYQDPTLGSGASFNGGVAPLGYCSGVSLIGMSAPTLSHDGAKIAFISCAYDLVSHTMAPPTSINQGSQYLSPHAYLFTRTSEGDQTTGPQGTVALVDPASDGSGVLAGDPRSNGMTRQVTVSGDGNWVTFTTAATDAFSADVTDANGTFDMGLLDVATGQRRLLSRNFQTPTQTANAESAIFGPAGPQISADGGKVVFFSYATDLIQSQSNLSLSAQIWMYDRMSDSVTLVTHIPNSATSGGDGQQNLPTPVSLSDSGRYLVFSSNASNLLATAPSTRYKVFLYDANTGQLSVVSHQAGSPNECYDDVGPGSVGAFISRNGDRVAFLSRCQDVDSVNPGNWPPAMGFVNHVYLWDRATSMARLVTRDAAYTDFAAYSSWGGNLPKFGAPLDDDGDVLTFGSLSTEVVPSTADGNDAVLTNRYGVDAYVHLIPPPPTLTVTVVGGGTVTSTPAGINCGADCSEVYVLNTVVTLAAVAAAGNQFDRWSGDCDAVGQVTMNALKTCTATFVPIPPADLEVTGSAASATVPRAGTAVVTFWVTNLGQATSTAVVATFQPPAKGTVTMPAACKKGKGKGAAITCSLGTMAAGDQVPLVFSISYRASQTGTFTTGLSVIASTPDSNHQNNAFTVSFTVGG